jgi:hypothetical protein
VSTRQRHHLAYDAEHHKVTAYRTRKEAAQTLDLFASIEDCRREVAGWPADMRVVATLPLHPAALET